MSEDERYTRQRQGEIAVTGDIPSDATIQFIGTIRTPFATRDDCPRRGDPEAGPDCRLELLERWHPALQGLEGFDAADVLYWLHQSRRDLVVQSPRHGNRVAGTFSLRSPVRPNPIGLSRVRILRVAPGVVHVRGLDCLDGTPLIDIKPSHCVFAPAPAGAIEADNR